MNLIKGFKDIFIVNKTDKVSIIERLIKDGNITSAEAVLLLK